MSTSKTMDLDPLKALVLKSSSIHSQSPLQRSRCLTILLLVRNANTATGLSWNASIIRPSTHGSKLREHLNEMDGFGTFGLSMIQFDRPILIETVTNTSVFIVNIEPNHPNFGKRIPLDLGAGSFLWRRVHEHFTALTDGQLNPAYFSRTPIGETSTKTVIRNWWVTTTSRTIDYTFAPPSLRPAS